MIILKKLKFDNCFSYGENNSLDLNEHTLTQIVGTNGVGKSSIPLIIEEVLFNKNSKGVKKADLPNRYKGDSYKISLELTKNEIEYYIEVIRKGSSIKVRLLKNGEDISSHTATNTFKTVQDEIIGIDFKTFSQLVYQNTNASLQFLTATDTARKKFLIDLLGLEEYVTYFEAFKEILKQLSTEISGVEGSIKTITSWLESNKLITTTALPIKSLPSFPQELEKELSDVRIALSNVTSTNKKILKNRQYKELISKIDITELHQTSTVVEIVSTDTFQKEIGQHIATKNAAKKAIDKIKNLHGVCPTCEQEINEAKNSELIELNTKLFREAENSIEELNSKIQKIEAQNKQFELKNRKIAEFHDLYRSIDRSLPDELVDENYLRTTIVELETKINDIKKEIITIEQENQKAQKHNTRIQVILEQTDKFKSDLEISNNKLQKLLEKSANLEILKKAFSTNGLLAYKIENLVKELEELTNSYLADLSDGRFTIQFVINNDKLNVEITDNGNIVDILALSSGELARVNTATLLAIRKLMSSISKTKINILFLDEVINVLDDNGREKLVEILIKEEELNTYLVSHGWTHPLLNKIDVVKRNNISFLE